ncbi:hypothetical protein ABC766_32025 (plasmid) [Methylobacterium fujisawaense]|uniref:hypothetical protein n=1 Tax=Methylobacterium fujisawaense TaxID=107400 RepID=UPI0031F48329
MTDPLKNGAISDPQLASQPGPPKSAEFQFERPDWTLFRSADTLAQKAGVRKQLLRRLVLKELADNALDSGARTVTATMAAPGQYVVQDDGKGIEGGPEAVARLFSVNRPLVSSKLWRLPSRGAMGNGLRVVVGAVAASDGSLVVTTRGRRLTLVPQADGSTAIERVEPVEAFKGTTVEITFGPALPVDPHTLEWAQFAITMAGGGEAYTGKPSPWWYDADAFWDLLQGAGDRLLREFIERLDGCTGAKAGRITKAFKGAPCRSLTRDQARELLTVARYEARPVSPARLGHVGRMNSSAISYAIQRGQATIGGREPKAEIPFVIEAWATAERRDEGGDEIDVNMSVNRTPAVANIEAWRSKGELVLSGCGLHHRCNRISPGRYSISVNLTTPWCPVTTDGKEPDLSPFVLEIIAAIEQAARRARGAMPRQPSAVAAGTTHKDIILRNLDAAVAKASGDGQYRFNQRQLFYVLRPIVIGVTGKEPSWENFCKIVTDYEAENEDIPGMYRDPRGTLYHPHLGQDISLGTLAVEQYERPAWTFGQILYLEKEGFFEALKAARWPERHDCALVTSKGFTTRAVRDLLDLLGEGEEPIRVFCVHDADAFGTMIFQTLLHETKARGARRVEVINLGLDPWEALGMGLSPENVEASDRSKAVADYVQARQDGPRWTNWLQTQRVELNEMTTPQLIAWLDGKMQAYGVGKVIPPTAVITVEAERQLAEQVEQRITARVLREAKIDEQVADALAAINLPGPMALAGAVSGWVSSNSDKAWTGGVAEIAADLAEAVEP